MEATKLTLEERIKRIEDELGITKLDADKTHRKDLEILYKSYGFSGQHAKGCAWSYSHQSIEDAEEWLQKRGATRIVTH